MAREFIYLKLLTARAHSALSYRASFILQCLAAFIAQTGGLISIIVIFSKVKQLGGFTRDEVLLIYAFADFAFSLASVFSTQLTQMSKKYIRTGTFDAFLLRPLNPLFQILVRDIELDVVLRPIAGLLIFFWVLSAIDIVWSVGAVLLLITAPICGAIIMCSLWVITCSLSFWIIDGSELSQTVPYGSRMFNLYPITIYPTWLRSIFAFVIPGAFIGYYPTLAIFNKPDPLGGPAFLGWLTPAIAVLIALLAKFIWELGIKHYQSTGS